MFFWNSLGFWWSNICWQFDLWFLCLFFFFFLYFYYLEANYFTILSWFLPYIDMNQPQVYMWSPSWTPLPPSSPSHPSGSSQCTSLEHLSHASNLGWWSVSHLIIHMFQCYSLKSSHPRLFPQSPKDCSLHLCLFCCLAYKVIAFESVLMGWMKLVPIIQIEVSQK